MRIAGAEPRSWSGVATVAAAVTLTVSAVLGAMPVRLRDGVSLQLLLLAAAVVSVRGRVRVPRLLGLLVLVNVVLFGVAHARASDVTLGEQPILAIALAGLACVVVALWTDTGATAADVLNRFLIALPWVTIPVAVLVGTRVITGHDPLGILETMTERAGIVESASSVSPVRNYNQFSNSMLIGAIGGWYCAQITANMVLGMLLRVSSLAMVVLASISLSVKGAVIGVVLASVWSVGSCIDWARGRHRAAITLMFVVVAGVASAAALSSAVGEIGEVQRLVKRTVRMSADPAEDPGSAWYERSRRFDAFVELTSSMTPTEVVFGMGADYHRRFAVATGGSEYSRDIDFPHSAPLSAFLYGGVVAAIASLAYLCAIPIQVRKLPTPLRGPLLAILAVLLTHALLGADSVLTERTLLLIAAVLAALPALPTSPR